MPGDNASDICCKHLPINALVCKRSLHASRPVGQSNNQTSSSVVQELDSAALLASPSNPEPQLPSAEAMHQLPYLDAVIHEGLRCFPPVPSGVGRALSEEVTVCGHTIPANVVLCFPIWTIHHSEEIWGADAGRWRPGRWLEGRSIAAAKKDAQGHARWLPFTLGPQNCLGQHLATVRFGWKLHC